MWHAEHQKLRHDCRDRRYWWNDAVRQVRTDVSAFDLRLAGLHRPGSEHFRLAFLRAFSKRIGRFSNPFSVTSSRAIPQDVRRLVNG